MPRKINITQNSFLFEYLKSLSGTQKKPRLKYRGFPYAFIYCSSFSKLCFSLRKTMMPTGMDKA